jgi:hypothetical protein
MRIRAIASILALSMATASVPVAALAQGMDADTKEAKVLFEDGLKLYKAGKAEEARVKFKAAYGLKKRPSIVLNLAHTELDTKRYVEAAFHFREALGLPGLDKDDQDNARAGIADARKNLGVVNIDAPAGTTLTIDGEVHAGAFTDGVEVLPGAHTVQLKGTDGKESVDKIQVVAGGTVTVRLRAGAAPKTEPPKTEPPKTEPPKTEPPKTEPPKTEPPKTEPPTTEPPKTEPPTTEPPTTEPPMRTPFLKTIHPVTYVAAGVTVVSAVLWPIFWHSMNVHKDNVDTLTRYLSDPRYANQIETIKAKGRDEVSSANTYTTLTNVFGVTTFVALGTTVATFFLLRKKDGTPTVAFTAVPTYGGASFSLAGTF